MSETTKNPPIATHRDGAVSAKVWRNFSKEGAPFYSVTFQRTYTDPKTSEPRETASFVGTDVLKVQQLASEAYRTISHERSQEKRYARGQQEPEAEPSEGGAPSQEKLDLADERDAAFEAAAPEQSRDRTSERQRAQGKEPSIG